MEKPLFTPLSSGAIDVLLQLFLQGPTWDGNIISKSDRDTLCKYGYAIHARGWAWLTPEGVFTALDAGMDREKERRLRNRDIIR